MEEIPGEFVNLDINQNNTLSNETMSLENYTEDISSEFGYCKTYLKPFEKYYSTIHGYNSLIICLFGAQANILNLIILTSKQMRTPTNLILTGLAVADLANMLEYIPFAIHRILPRNNSYEWALYVFIHSNFSQVCHTTSIWLAVTLAIWRYVMVTRYNESKTLCSMKRAKCAVLAAYLFSGVLCTPIYFSFAVKSVESFRNGTALSLDQTTESPLNNTRTQYVVNMSDLALKYPFLKTANFWLYSVVIKIIPCAIFTVVSCRLMNSLTDVKIHKGMLFPMRKIHAETRLSAHRDECSSKELTQPRATRTSCSFDSSSGSDLTNRMLLAILFLFLITEFPQGLLGLMSGIMGDSFFNNCYNPLGDLMDFVALLNSAINFILYCTMSEKFRETFMKVFSLGRVIRRCPFCKE
ncbi:unnamed protein product [Orchesella dallaii]|uniref:G-protein coupled receptors family 1 profile domain-containing protein n=1 Tax=Orchesella dallaii TaxID=48710 RepID=A0ABP1R6Y7_9HEXA